MEKIHYINFARPATKAFAMRDIGKASVCTGDKGGVRVVRSAARATQ
jgi:hypothetical protein